MHRFPPLQGNETGAVERIDGALPLDVPDVAIEIALAGLVVLFGWYLSQVVVQVAGRTVAQRIERPSVTRTVLRLIRGVVMLVALFVAAGVLGIRGAGILIPATVFTAVLGVVLAPLVGSLINGLFVLTDQPYEIGDMIEISDAGHRGFVEDITIRYTKIFTLDNTFIVIPNSEIHSRDVVNYSAEDERTRLSIRFEITYESDLDEARRIAERAARSVDDVITGGPDIRIGSARYPAAPRCYVDEYAASGILLALRFWAKHPYKLLALRSAIQDRIRERMADADVEIAYPHTHHVFDETSGTARVAMGERPGERAVDPPRPADGGSGED